MSDLESSPDEPWITEEGKMEASPAVDVETGKERDIEEMADPRTQGDVPDPSPVKSRTPKKTDEEKWEEYLEAYDEFNKLKKQYDDKIKQTKKDFIKKNPGASKQEKKDNLVKYKKKIRNIDKRNQSNGGFY